MVSFSTVAIFFFWFCAFAGAPPSIRRQARRKAPFSTAFVISIKAALAIPMDAALVAIAEIDIEMRFGCIIIYLFIVDDYRVYVIVGGLHLRNGMEE